MQLSQIEIDEFLDRHHHVPIVEYGEQKIPRDNHNYDKLLDIINAGFDFTARELLHAIGCKTAVLPLNEQDECIKSAYKYLHLLDIEAKTLCFRDVNISSDFHSILSQEIGVGMMCLLASRAFGVDWDQLESIPGRGMRFDYRAPIASEGTGIFEAKGTKYMDYQESQILNGIEKKEAHHERDEHFDVELIVATYVGERGTRPRILVADPELDIPEMAFGPRSSKLYRYRHFARVLQFLGLPYPSRIYYLISDEILRGEEWLQRGNIVYPKDLDTIFVKNVEFVGRWFDRWLPSKSKRYKRFYGREDYILSKELRFKCFQGISKRAFENLVNINPDEIVFLSWQQCYEYKEMEGGVRVSVFPDSTILAFEAI